MFWRKKKKKQEAEDQREAAAQQAEEDSGREEAAPPEPDPAQAVDAAPAPEAPAAAEPDTPEPTGEPAQQPAAEEQTRPEPAGEEEASEKKRGFFGRMADRLLKTREKISGSIDRITLGKKIDDEVLDELEEVLVTADLGVPTTLELIEGLRGKVARKELDDAEALKKALAQGIQTVLENTAPPPSRDNDPHVIMVVGVNGVGKTTSIGKLAHRFQQTEKRQVLLAAGDTFRAAAGEQLEVWAQRAGCDIVRQKHGADPSAVAWDAVDAAQNRGKDLVIIDTAGRLHTKVNLMEELKKVQRVVAKRLPGAPHEVLLVLDATTGQNAVSQAKLFHQAVPLNGLILTKLDGTAKGGVVVAIAKELKLPICYVGLGEGIEDLRPFDPAEFAKALF
ncbi:cell division protein FtsY [Desulfocarbo indianensis]|nr:cell division protein FtsY [Desulfocarbo indianensis]